MYIQVETAKDTLTFLHGSTEDECLNFLNDMQRALMVNDMSVTWDETFTVLSGLYGTYTILPEL